MVADGVFYLGGLSLNVGHDVAGNRPASNAVPPAWRETITSILIVSTWNFTAPFSQMLDVQNRLTEEIGPAIYAVTPGSGTYLNEGDFQVKNWKDDFYGANYPRLLDVKKMYDPSDIFYATTAVGSDAWVVASDGRLCRA